MERKNIEREMKTSTAGGRRIFLQILELFQDAFGCHQIQSWKTKNTPDQTACESELDHMETEIKRHNKRTLMKLKRERLESEANQSQVINFGNEAEVIIRQKVLLLLEFSPFSIWRKIDVRLFSLLFNILNFGLIIFYLDPTIFKAYNFFS